MTDGMSPCSCEYQASNDGRKTATQDERTFSFNISDKPADTRNEDETIELLWRGERLCSYCSISERLVVGGGINSSIRGVSDHGPPQGNRPAYSVLTTQLAR
jgi:hypothetical protein